MTDAGIRFVTVYPERSLKEAWIGRCYCRGNDAKFIEFISSSWDKFMDDVYSEPTGDKLYRLQTAEHLSDIMEMITREWNSRTRLNDMVDDDAPLLELSDEDIDEIATEYAASRCKRISKRYYDYIFHLTNGR